MRETVLLACVSVGKKKGERRGRMKRGRRRRLKRREMDDVNKTWFISQCLMAAVMIEAATAAVTLLRISSLPLFVFYCVLRPLLTSSCLSVACRLLSHIYILFYLFTNIFWRFHFNTSLKTLLRMNFFPPKLLHYEYIWQKRIKVRKQIYIQR